MSIEVFTTTSTLKCLLTTEFICYFSSATNTLRYMAVYSKYVQNYNLISGHIEVKMLKISKTISTLKCSLVVLILKKKLTCIQRTSETTNFEPSLFFLGKNVKILCSLDWKFPDFNFFYINSNPYFWGKTLYFFLCVPWAEIKLCDIVTHTQTATTIFF